MSWLACSLVLLAADPLSSSQISSAAVPSSTSASRVVSDTSVTGSTTVTTKDVDIRGCQWHATSPNFSVRNFHAAHDARKVAEYCERWRTRLQKYWIADEQDAWKIKCEVVVHAGIGTYLTAVGPGGRPTFGSSLIKFASDKEVARRLIDFRGDDSNGLAAVPHEMTHIVLADLLGGRQPPRWADEGMAILAEIGRASCRERGEVR